MKKKKWWASGVPATRTFNGVKYYLFSGAQTKREAVVDAGRLRKNGYNARIYPNPESWSVYSNPKTPHWYSAVYLSKRK